MKTTCESDCCKDIMRQYTNIDDLKARIHNNMESAYSFNIIHGSNENCFENIAFCIGMSQDIINDEDILLFYEFYRKKFCMRDDIMNSDFVRTIVLNCLLYMSEKLGVCDDTVMEAFYERLDRVYDFSISGEHIFYTNEERKSIRSIPEVWINVGVVRYEHTNPYLRLPNVYDLLGLSKMYGINVEIDKKIDAVIQYVFSDNYQEEVTQGYGIGINGEKGFVKSAFYAVGWDIGVSHLKTRQTLLYMRLLAKISEIGKVKWYQDNLSRYRDAVENEDNLLLTEIYKPIKKTYWSSGCYMNFGQNKTERKKSVISVINEFSV